MGQKIDVDFGSTQVTVATCDECGSHSFNAQMQEIDGSWEIVALICEHCGVVIDMGFSVEFDWEDS